MILGVIVTMATVWLASVLLPGIQVADTGAALIAGLVLSLVYLLVRPVVKMLTSPLNFITLGLVGFVVDVGMIYLCSWIMGDRFVVTGFLWAVLLSVIVNAVRSGIGGATEKRR